MLRRIFIWLGIGLLVLVAASALLCVGYVCRSEESFWPDEKFTAEPWNTGDERHAIAKDLLRSGILDRMSKEEVVALLGRPDPGGIGEDGTIRDNISYTVKMGSMTFRGGAVWFIRILFVCWTMVCRIGCLFW